MNKMKIVFRCFGLAKGIKYLYYKFIASILKKIYIKYKHINLLNNMLRVSVNTTDRMVEDYIYVKYQNIYNKYSNNCDVGVIPEKKIIWTAWLQGISDLPYAVNLCIESMKKNSGEYEVVILTLENISKYLKIDESILDLYINKKIKPAHFADYLRVRVLSEHGGVWLDATQYLVDKIPDDVWNYKLIVWNKIEDITGSDSYVAIPFVKYFNNSFLVGRKNSLFFQLYSEISEALLTDPILQIDYFSNFKAIFAAINHIEIINHQWKDMRIINRYGLITRQMWNKSITPNMKKIISEKDNFFFMLTYKKEWIKEIDGRPTIQEYIVRNY